jgi:hypothetical protein
MRTLLKNRVTKIEDALERRGGRTPVVIKEDGIEARICYAKRRTVPDITIWYDSRRFEPDEALATIAPRLPPHGHIFAFPFRLTAEEWERKFAETLKHV